MTIKTSGTLSLQEINAEFGLGTNLYAYRGVKWFKDDGSRGYFDQAMGNNPPIDILEFYGKRKTIPVVASDRYYSNGEIFTVPYYNKIIVTLIGGQAGGRGSNGYDEDRSGNKDYRNAGGDGSPGNPSKFGNSPTYASSPGGSPNSNYGPTVTYTIDAETNQNFLQVGVPAIITIGGGGGGGGGGLIRQEQYQCQTVCVPGYGCATACAYVWVNIGYAGGGANGNSGSVRIQVL